MNGNSTALADRQLSRVRGLCAQVGFKYVDVEPNFLGGGIAVGFGPNDYAALSVMAGAENLLMLTSGILKDLQQDRDAALQIVNRCNQSNTVFTVYLHDADVSWSLLAQRTTPVEAFFKDPRLFEALVRGPPPYAASVRTEVAQETSLGVMPWEWSGHELNQLVIRSMV